MNSAGDKTMTTETMTASDAAALVTSVYEQDGAWACADGHGNEIAAGLRSRAEAERRAAAWVLERAGERRDEAMLTISSAADIQTYVYNSHSDLGADVGNELVIAIQNADHPRYGSDWAEWLAANIDDLREEAIEANAAGHNETLVLLESMPDQHRESHRAAGNWGSYPANGARRFVMPRVEAQEVVDSDDDKYDRIVRVATGRDVEHYGTEDRPEGW